MSLRQSLKLAYFRPSLGKVGGCSWNWVSSWSAGGRFSHYLDVCVCVACHTYSEPHRGFPDLCVSKESSRLIQEGRQHRNKEFLIKFLYLGLNIRKAWGCPSDAAHWILTDRNVSAFAWGQSFDCKIISYNWILYHGVMPLPLLYVQLESANTAYWLLLGSRNCLSFEKIRKYNR